MLNEKPYMSKNIRTKKIPFFKRRSKMLHLSYKEVSIFLILYIIFMIGLFRNVIYNYLASFWYQ